jgi:zinc transporter 5/7
VAGLVSDSFHLTFGCGVLAFSLYAMMVAEQSPSDTYTYGYKRLEVLAAFTNALFLLFLSFSLAVEALHAFVEDESKHKYCPNLSLACFHLQFWFLLRESWS